MLGRSKFLSFISNILRPNLNIYLEGNFSKFIHGSTMITKSGFEDKINLLRANLYEALDKPLMFKKRNFIWPFWKDQPLSWFINTLSVFSFVLA